MFFQLRLARILSRVLSCRISSITWVERQDVDGRWREHSQIEVVRVEPLIVVLESALASNALGILVILLPYCLERSFYNDVPFRTRSERVRSATEQPRSIMSRYEHQAQTTCTTQATISNATIIYEHAQNV